VHYLLDTDLRVFSLQGSATASGLQPERVDFYEPDAPRRIEKVIDADTQEIFDIPRGKPQGVKSMHKHYISRPESLEYVHTSLRSEIPPHR
jgi:hypothetical protein